MIRKLFALEQLFMERIIHMTITLTSCFGINQLIWNPKENFSSNINIISIMFLKYLLKQGLKDSLLLNHKIIFKYY